MLSLSEKVLKAVSAAIGKPSEQVLLHSPYFPPSTYADVKSCIDTGWVSSAGAFVTELESAVCEIVGCKHAIATVNGTTALQVALYSSGVTAGDEVLIPSLTFVATANAVRHQGAIPHFVDVSPDRMGMSSSALRERLIEIAHKSNNNTKNRLTGRRIAAICPMHCFGIPCEIDEIVAIADNFKIPVVEDCAESLGSYYKGTHTGRFGMVSAFSFNGNKILTTGGGGAICTDNDSVAALSRHVTTTGKLPHQWEFEHDRVAWNYRMPNINAALGIGQLKEFPLILQKKAAVFDSYARAFNDLDEVEIRKPPRDCVSNNWLISLILESPDIALRDEILALLNSSHYQSRPLWKPMHSLSMNSDCPHGPLPTTEALYKQVIALPSSPSLSQHN